ncbi:MAG: ABC transporter ATP-binding protein [Lachnospiraceae bacterium]|nr:ABC transporter ATP-binding protein [Lachnospiraceae bacterium]
MNNIIVKTTGLKKYYQLGKHRVKALDGVDFSVEEGEFVSIIGKSGSGKSTLLHLIGGLDTPTAGDVCVDNIHLAKMSREELAVFRRRNIGFIFQNYNLVPDLNVFENITLPVELDGGKPDREFIREILSLLQLEDKTEALPGNLSGGQQQRIAIARAVASKPGIILADEPTGNLDTSASHDVMGLLKTVAKLYEQTILLITHDYDIAQLADRIVQIEDGKIVKGDDIHAGQQQ